MTTRPRARWQGGGQKRGTLVAHIRVAYWYNKTMALMVGWSRQALGRRRLCIAEISRRNYEASYRLVVCLLLLYVQQSGLLAVEVAGPVLCFFNHDH